MQDAVRKTEENWMLREVFGAGSKRFIAGMQLNSARQGEGQAQSARPAPHASAVFGSQRIADAD